MSIKVLVVDDTLLFRRIIGDALKSLPTVEVIGEAANGQQALEKIEKLQPDVVTLDIEMPVMDGLQVLEALKAAKNECGVIVISSLTQNDGPVTMKALEKGAFDFITKPAGGSIEDNRKQLAAELNPRLLAFLRRREFKRQQARPLPTTPVNTAGTVGAVERLHKMTAVPKPEILLIGVSTGGPNALGELVPGLSGQLGIPVLIVQHMPPFFTKSLAETLDAKAALRVKEAEHGDELSPNTVYIAPGGRQMKLGLTGSKIINITNDPPENNCKPAVDYTFRSVANAMPGKALAVILTGMGSDGTLGLKLLKRGGCHVLGQDEASCVVWGMSKAAIEAGVVDEVLPLSRMATRINQIVRGL